ncbi:MAG: tRNA lysidine(34) synthetase TilS [Anaerolineae bacterium]|nr:tRNA lysidine(34) synthetase TilS [Anaerolineae bacterium]
MDLLVHFQKTLRQQRLLQPAEPVVVGVSGGPDSVALLDLLRRAGFHPHVAHLHHGLRGADADADAEFVMALAARWELPCTLARADVPAYARQAGLAFEEAARRMRYGFLLQTAQQLCIASVAVGHHADDQAETVLMHLLRGTGPSGLRGMAPVTPFETLAPLLVAPDGMPVSCMAPLRLLRPLLDVPRAAIEAYCSAQGLPTRFDRSNLDTTFFRNRLRHETLPYLMGLNPRISERLCRLAEVVRADYALLEQLVDTAWKALILDARPDAVVFALEGWRAQPLALQRMLLRRAAWHVRRTLRDMDFTHVEAAVQVAQSGATGAAATLPRGLMLRVGYATLSISAETTADLPETRPWLVPGTRVALPVAGELELPGGWTFSVTPEKAWNLEAIAANSNSLAAWVDAAAAGAGLWLRTRERGDRFRPQGLGGVAVRLSDFLINARIPRNWRDSLPLLIAGTGEILWIVGLRLSEAALVRAQTTAVLRLEAHPPSVW